MLLPNNETSPRSVTELLFSKGQAEQIQHCSKPVERCYELFLGPQCSNTGD